MKTKAAQYQAVKKAKEAEDIAELKRQLAEAEQRNSELTKMAADANERVVKLEAEKLQATKPDLDNIETADLLAIVEEQVEASPIELSTVRESIKRLAKMAFGSLVKFVSQSVGQEAPQEPQRGDNGIT